MPRIIGRPLRLDCQNRTVSPLDALLLVDLQAGLFDGDAQVHDARGVAERAQRLLAAARAARTRVVFVQDDQGPGLWSPSSDGWALIPELAPLPAEARIEKTFGDAFRATSLEQVLRDAGRQHLVVAGCMTDFSVRATLQRALLKGFVTTLVSDCHSTLDSPDAAAADHVATLNAEVATAERHGLPVRARTTAEVVAG